jgi:HEAT repeat protein
MRKITCALLLAICFSFPVTASVTKQAAASTSDSKPPTASQSETASKPSKDQAWDLLESGLTEDCTDRRATAVRVLSLLTRETRAVTLACDALGDPKPLVRVAAAFALGELHARSSIPKLETALSDKEPVVVLAAAHSLLAMKEAAAYQVYNEILTGERKGKKGFVGGELDTLRDPKKMALLGFQEGIGFVPLAGIGYTTIRTIVKDDSSPVRAAAARVLADDRDPDIDDALVQVAIGDKSQLVRTAALDALARRGNPEVIDRIAPALSDEKDSVKYTAAAAIVHLSDVAERRNRKQK